ncbi:hypothetical protein JOM56_006943 [Amanita muscaria]|uniref:Uncharacterized protein n=1 Tax=Amanita muscaria (strain Koide BX008) TaxID=946122 RepID=A0A0C2T5E4_AMAMK|nr:hypothetical protein M378DRAFT_114203 [Amanita muscaria Koide BX008]
MASSQPDEERFKAHIRQLLFPYAKTYLTVDYVEWTEKARFQLLQQYLRDVPVDDPASLWLPQDPFDTLARLHNLSRLTAYEERWQTNSHALALIKESLAGLSGKTRSEKAPFFDNCESDDALS